MVEIISCTSAECTNKPNHITEETALLLHSEFSLRRCRGSRLSSVWEQNKHRFAAQGKRTFHGSSDSLRNNYFTQPRP